MIIKYSQHIINQLKVFQNSSTDEIKEREDTNTEWHTEIFFNFLNETSERVINKYNSKENVNELVKQQKNEYKKLNFEDSNKFYKYHYLLQNNIKPFTDNQKRFNLTQVHQQVNSGNYQWLIFEDQPSTLIEDSHQT